MFKQTGKCNKPAKFRYVYNDEYFFRCADHILNIEHAAKVLNIDPEIEPLEDSKYFCSKHTGD